MTLSGPRIRDASLSVDGRPCVYGLGVIYQVAPTQIAVQVNRRPSGVAVVDYEDGVDCFVIDRIEALGDTAPTPILRNAYDRHPETGQRIILTTYPAVGGFVPLGAKRDDGSPHPHAGTGFGLAVVLGYPADHADPRPERRGDTLHRWSLQQWRFDGRRFIVEHTDMLHADAVLPDLWVLFRHPITPARQDGDDLLLPVSAGRAGAAPGSGISRWRRIDNAWRPVDFTPVTPGDYSIEPSLIRDVDGQWLLSVRGYGLTDETRPRWTEGVPETWDALRLYRSPDAIHWREAMTLHVMRSISPIVLNRTVEGQPFFAGNPLRRACFDARGRLRQVAWMREDLFLWPITDDRASVGRPVNVLDARSAFGACRDDPARHVNFWAIDHPVGAVVRLADGRWHSLLGFRLCDTWEILQDDPPTAQSGYWLESIHATTPGDTRPPIRL